MAILGRFFQVYRGRSRKMYNDTMRAIDKVAAASSDLLAQKSPDEVAVVLQRATVLIDEVHRVTERETPLVVALTLLVALRVHCGTMGDSLKTENRFSPDYSN
jgi:hypothetical protein